MAELIAQGPDSQQRWRRPLRVEEPFVLGRTANGWAVPWESFLSREHVACRWHEGRLEVRRLPEARNPIFHQGQESNHFELRAGEHFVVGQTTFTLVNERVDVVGDLPRPVEEQTFSAQYLRQIRFRNADHRIDVLTRLPEVILGSVDDAELAPRIVNMLLAGIPQAGAVALVAAREQGEGHALDVLHWDRRLQTDGEFRPSQRLITEALERGQSVLHVWSGAAVGGGGSSPLFTLHDNVDWAFSTPIESLSRDGWTLYVAGRFARDQIPAPRRGGDDDDSHEPLGPGDLREDIKFTELMAATIRSLRQVQRLERTQATLSQFFAPAVLSAVGSSDPEVVLAPRETDVSVMFCDLRGFSRESEKSADNLLGLLQRVSQALGVTTHQILEQGGVFGDFQGDAAMGFWGWPLPQADKVQRAARAALAIRQQFATAARQPHHPLSNFRMGIGLATGRAVAGRIGTTDQVKVTVFGPLVNRASRLEGMTKLLHAGILLDETTARLIRAEVPTSQARVRRVAIVCPYGMQTPLEVSELLPPQGEDIDLTDEQLSAYERALDAFIAGRWDEAWKLLHLVPAEDRVKDFLTLFIASRQRTPPADWNGVIPMTTKG